MLSNKVYLGHLEYGKRINSSYKSKKVKYIPQDEWKIVHNKEAGVAAPVGGQIFSEVLPYLEVQRNRQIKE